MRKIILLIAVMLGLSNVIVAEDNTKVVNVEKMSKKERKAYDKRQKEIFDSVAHAEAVQALRDGVYLLLIEKTMDTVLVEHPEDQRVNFMLVENDKILYQTGKGGEYTGNNGLGGFTIISDIVGEITVEGKKSGEVKSEFNIVSEYLSGRVKVKLDKKSNYGEIGILEQSNGNYTVMLGHIVPFDVTMVGDVIQIGRLYVPDGWDPFTLGKKRDVGVMMDYVDGTR